MNNLTQAVALVGIEYISTIYVTVNSEQLLFMYYICTLFSFKIPYLFHQTEGILMECASLCVPIVIFSLCLL